MLFVCSYCLNFCLMIRLAQRFATILFAPFENGSAQRFANQKRSCLVRWHDRCSSTQLLLFLFLFLFLYLLNMKLIFCCFANLQRAYYTAIKNRDLDALTATADPNKVIPKPSLMNLLMQMRKVCNHPVIFFFLSHCQLCVWSSHARYE